MASASNSCIRPLAVKAMISSGAFTREKNFGIGIDEDLCPFWNSMMNGRKGSEAHILKD